MEPEASTYALNIRELRLHHVLWVIWAALLLITCTLLLALEEVQPDGELLGVVGTILALLGLVAPFLPQIECIAHDNPNDRLFAAPCNGQTAALQGVGIMLLMVSIVLLRSSF